MYKCPLLNPLALKNFRKFSHTFLLLCYLILKCMKRSMRFAQRLAQLSNTSTHLLSLLHPQLCHPPSFSFPICTQPGIRCFFPPFQEVYGGSQARGPIGAVVASLCHSNAGSEPHLQLTHSSQQRRILNPLSKARH